MAKKTEGKSAGQHLDAAISTTKQHAQKSKEFFAKHAKKTSEKVKGLDTKKMLIIGGAIFLILLLILLWPRDGERATMDQAASIARMLKADGVPIRAIEATRRGYEVTYAAEDAVGRFDDAILYDWAMIYGTAAAHECGYISITTTLMGEQLHRQTVPCEAVRAFVRGVFTEEEFWLLVEHENIG